MAQFADLLACGLHRCRIGKESEHLCPALSKNLHGRAGFVGLIGQRRECLPDAGELLAGVHLAQGMDGQAEPRECLSRGLAFLVHAGEGFLQLCECAADAVRAEASVFKCLLQDDEIGDLLACVGGEVRHFPAEIERGLECEDVGDHAGESATERGELAGKRLGVGAEIRQRRIGTTNALHEGVRVERQFVADRHGNSGRCQPSPEARLFLRMK